MWERYGFLLNLFLINFDHLLVFGFRRDLNGSFVHRILFDGDWLITDLLGFFLFYLLNWLSYCFSILHLDVLFDLSGRSLNLHWLILLLLLLFFNLHGGNWWLMHGFLFSLGGRKLLHIDVLSILDFGLFHDFSFFKTIVS
jgi:hypothetical protein